MSRLERPGKVDVPPLSVWRDEPSKTEVNLTNATKEMTNLVSSLPTYHLFGCAGV